MQVIYLPSLSGLLSLSKLQVAVDESAPILPPELRRAIVREIYDPAIIGEKFKALKTKEEAVQLFKEGVFSADYIFEKLVEASQVRVYLIFSSEVLSSSEKSSSNLSSATHSSPTDSSPT